MNSGPLQQALDELNDAIYYRECYKDKRLHVPIPAWMAESAAHLAEDHERPDIAEKIRAAVAAGDECDECKQTSLLFYRNSRRLCRTCIRDLAEPSCIDLAWQREERNRAILRQD